MGRAGGLGGGGEGKAVRVDGGHNRAAPAAAAAWVNQLGGEECSSDDHVWWLLRSLRRKHKGNMEALSEDAVRWQDAAVHGALEAHGYSSPVECSLLRGWPWMRAPRPAAPLSPLRSLQGHKKGRGGAAARHKRRRGRDGHRCPDAAPLGGRARAWSGTSQTPCHHGHWAALRARHRGWLPRPASCKGIGGLL